MQTQTLNGQWELSQVGRDDSFPASVPGCVHTDLLAAGAIEDPFFRDNELRTLWVGEADWTYRRTFEVTANLLEHERILLRCHGLDTIATVTLNGFVIGETDNMYRTWEFDVKPLLAPGINMLAITFTSAMTYVRERNARRPLPGWGIGQDKLDTGSWIRKQPSNFGWDWGPMLVTCGIWKDIELVAFNTARLADVAIHQDHSQPGRVGLTVSAVAERTGEAPLTVHIAASFEGEVVAEASAPLGSDGSASIDLMIDDPELWWPNGLGDQPLYDLTVTLIGPDGQTLDFSEKRIGLRTLILDRHEDAWGESFQFVANGVPFFAKGGNWIPADTFVARLTPADYRRLLEDSAAANMNMIRVWGGGLYESDAFYDVCDELGLCVWQDFIFACTTYPGFDQDFLANVKAEAEDNVRRLRHHASLALWCGNNELEQGLVGPEWTDRTMSWKDYSAIFDTLLPDVVARLDPQTAYWPGSPHSPHGDRADWLSPKWGDTHLWQVWHGKEPFEWYRTAYHRFVSEFGFQSFPEPRTTYGYTAPDDRNITSYVMEHHQRSRNGNAYIVHYMTDWFRMPSSFENWLWLSQILQAMGIKYAVEHWRRNMPRCMGALYWQINDCWPVASWASIDYPGRWKALHYLARRFYSPYLVSGVENQEQGTVALFVTSDDLDECPATLPWAVTDAAGETLDSGSLEITLPANGSLMVEALDLEAHLTARTPRDVMLWLDLEVDGEIVSSNFVSFARPKHLMLRQPNLAFTVEPAGERTFRVTLEVQHPALWTWLTLSEGEARFSDNFVHVRPDHPVEIMLTVIDGPTTEDAVRRALVVQSLFDTYTEK